VLTVFSGGRALFGGAEMGAVVSFVLWFNFLAGFVYVTVGLGLWRRAPFAPIAAAGIAIATAGVFVALLWHVWAGGAYELRTILAMMFRLGIWSVIAILTLRGVAD
jgi:hypothetical protein